MPSDSNSRLCHLSIPPRGRSAAYLWGLERRAPQALEQVIPYGRSVRVPARPGGLRIRRSMRWADLIDDREFPWRTTRAATVR